MAGGAMQFTLNYHAIAVADVGAGPIGQPLPDTTGPPALRHANLACGPLKLSGGPSPTSKPSWPLLASPWHSEKLRYRYLQRFSKPIE
jgi:hypothetical protein